MVRFAATVFLQADVCLISTLQLGCGMTFCGHQGWLSRLLGRVSTEMNFAKGACDCFMCQVNPA